MKSNNIILLVLLVFLGFSTRAQIDFSTSTVGWQSIHSWAPAAGWDATPAPPYSLAGWSLVTNTNRDQTIPPTGSPYTYCDGQYVFPDGAVNMIWWDSVPVPEYDSASFRYQFVIPADSCTTIDSANTLLEGWADDEMTIWVNGTQIGHTSTTPGLDKQTGALSTTASLTAAFIAALHPGTNVIGVRANDLNPNSYYCVGFALKAHIALNQCCTKPIAYLVINGDTMTGSGTDTLCQDVLPNIQLFGGEWGQIMVDGRIIQDSPQDTNWYFSMDSLIAGGGLPIGNLFDSVAGFHTLCFIAATDSASHCADTICANIFIRPCCSPPAAQLYIDGSQNSTDTICFGSTLHIAAYGGTWGIVYSDSVSNGEYVQIPDTGYIISLPLEDSTALGVHQICFMTYSDSSMTCGDTICRTVVLTRCCTSPPPASIMILGGDSQICVNGFIVLSVSGGSYGMFLPDGLNTPYRDYQPGVVFSANDSGTLVGIVPDTNTVPGYYTICYVSYSADPDSTAFFCSDTSCITVHVQYCPCTPPAQSLYFTSPSGDTTSTVCEGSIYYLHIVGNGAWGSLLVDGAPAPGMQPDTIPLAALPAGGIPIGPLDTPLTIGTHVVTLVSHSTFYNGELPDCPDTTSISFTIQNCGCEFTHGTNYISSYSSGLNYTFYDSFTLVQPNFINWIVDDSNWGQTGGADTFYHTFSPGFHTVCMQTATILTNADGSNICCYNTICDTVNIDACEYWKSTDTITYQLNTTNIDSVTFTFHGSTSPISPTIVWNFGDGTTLVSTDLTVTHVFSPNWVEKHKNRLEVCADIIWSKGDSINYDSLSVCCCLDHRCFPVFVSVCNIPSFNVELLSDNIYTGAYVFDVVSAPAGVVSIDMPSWISSDGSSTTDWTFEDDITYDTEYDICATFDYYVTYQGKPYECPTTTVCLDTFLSNPNPKDRFRAYPNPTTGQMVVEITNNTNAKSAKIEVSDVTGQVLLSTVNSLTTGINQKFMNLSNLSQGVYTIKMTIGSEQQMIKLVKE